MTDIAGTAASMGAFIEKQARMDAVVNIVLAGGINYWLTSGLPFVPGTLPFGDPAPNLGRTLIAIAVLISVMLIFIAAVLAYFMSKSTTRATLKLG